MTMLNLATNSRRLILKQFKFVLLLCSCLFLSACYESQTHLDIASDGSANIVETIGLNLPPELMNELKASNELSCAKLEKNKKNHIPLICKDIAVNRVEIQRSVTPEQAKGFLTQSKNWFSSHYEFDPIMAFFVVNQDLYHLKNREDLLISLNKLKSIGGTATLTVTMPGNIIQIGTDSPKNNTQTARVNLLSSDVQNSSYKIVSKDSQNWILFIGIALSIIALGLIYYMIKSKTNCRHKKSCIAATIGLIIAILILFSLWWAQSKPAKETQTPIASASVAEVSKPLLLPPPDENMAFKVLYADVPNQNGTLKLKRGDIATLIAQKDLTDPSGTQYHIFLIKRYSDDRNSHADGAEIDAVVFKNSLQNWEVSSARSNLTLLGSFGETEVLSEKEQAQLQVLQIGQDTMALLLPTGASNQGTTSSGVEVIGIGNQFVKDLGFIPTEESNDGACGEAFGPCYSWTSTIKAGAIPSTGFAKLLVKQVGSKLVGEKKVNINRDIAYTYTKASGYQSDSTQ